MSGLNHKENDTQAVGLTQQNHEQCFSPNNNLQNLNAHYSTDNKHA